MLSRTLTALVVAVTALSGCGGSDVDISGVPELPDIETAGMEQLLADSDIPVVLNVWASWCVPCRSEAPLLSAAAEEYEGRVAFVGLAVRDNQTGARRFIAEFLADTPMEHFFDDPGNIPVDLGGSRAVPLTFFYAAGGEQVDAHLGILDEATLLVGIDELLVGATG